VSIKSYLCDFVAAKKKQFNFCHRDENEQLVKFNFLFVQVNITFPRMLGNTLHHTISVQGGLDTWRNNMDIRINIKPKPLQVLVEQRQPNPSLCDKPSAINIRGENNPPNLICDKPSATSVRGMNGHHLNVPEPQVLEKEMVTTPLVNRNSFHHRRSINNFDESGNAWTDAWSYQIAPHPISSEASLDASLDARQMNSTPPHNDVVKPVDIGGPMIFWQSGMEQGGHTLHNGITRRDLARVLGDTLVKVYKLDVKAMPLVHGAAGLAKQVHPMTFMFQCKSEPVLPIPKYIESLVISTLVSGEALMLGMAHLARFSKNVPSFPINSLTIHRLVLVALLCASKFHDDSYANNARYAKAGGIPTKELGKLEVEFLYLMKFNLYVSAVDYATLYQELLVFNPLSPKHKPININSPLSPRSIPSSVKQIEFFTPARPLVSIKMGALVTPTRVITPKDPELNDEFGGRSLALEPDLIITKSQPQQINDFFPCIFDWIRINPSAAQLPTSPNPSPTSITLPSPKSIPLAVPLAIPCASATINSFVGTKTTPHPPPPPLPALPVDQKIGGWRTLLRSQQVRIKDVAKIPPTAIVPFGKSSVVASNLNSSNGGCCFSG